MDAIRIDALTKRYGSTLALDTLTLRVPEGEVFGFLGPNGAGKTTTLRLLLGLLRPTSGSATILGLDTQRDATRLHRQVGFVPGDVPVWPWLTGRQMLELLGRLHGGVDTAYRDELVERFEFDPSKLGRAYSHGNRQKVAVIAAFATRAPLLILDEPTGGLDPLMEMQFRACVHEARERGQTVLLSSHILSEVEATCDRVGILRGGRLVETGTLDELRRLAVRSVEVTFTGEVPDLAQVPGVLAVEVVGRTATMQVRGEVGPLLAAVQAAGVADLLAREASLEEIFLTHYGSDAERA